MQFDLAAEGVRVGRKRVARLKEAGSCCLSRGGLREGGALPPSPQGPSAPRPPPGAIAPGPRKSQNINCPPKRGSSTFRCRRGRNYPGAGLRWRAPNKRGPILPLMPEEPEVETESIREGIREELERQGGGFLKRIALTTALLAALAAIAALRAGATVNEALMLRTEAARLQSEASDQWAFFQAKGLKTAIEEASRTSWLAIGKEPPPEYAAKQERQAAERKEIEAKAREKEKERDEKIAESDHLLHEHHGFANTVAILQVSIALGAVAALTHNRAVWITSLLLGAGGLALFAVTFLR